MTKLSIGSFGDIDLEVYLAYSGKIHLASDSLDFDTAITSEQLQALTDAAQSLEDNA